MAKADRSTKPAAPKPPHAHGGPALPPKLDARQIATELLRLPEWAEVGGSIQRTFAFANFVQSMNFVTTVAAAAEADAHHPDILIRYNKVTLSLNTHDAGGITAKDFALAAKADHLAALIAPVTKPTAPA